MVSSLCSETVDHSADPVLSPFALFVFTQAKCQVNENLSTKCHVRAVARSLVFAGGEMGVCFLPAYVTSFKMDWRNLYLPIITAIIGALFQAKMIEQSCTSESNSRQCLLNNVLLHVIQRGRAALSRRWRRQEHMWSTYHHSLTCRLRELDYNLLVVTNHELMMPVWKTPSTAC